MAARFGPASAGASSGKKDEHGVVQRQAPFGDGQAGGGRGEALAEREEHVGRFRPVRVPPALGDDVAVAHEHQAVQPEVVPLRRVHEGAHGGRGDALRLRRAPGQGLVLCHECVSFVGGTFDGYRLYSCQGETNER